MVTRSSIAAVRDLWTGLVPPDLADWTDAQLLEAFLTQRDQGAFSALMKRHGPMVWGVCRRVLSNLQDAEDAFQATFLVLVRKAASIVPGQMVGNWLHGVAYRTARKVRTISQLRRQREGNPCSDVDSVPTGETPQDDLNPILDRELSCLPAKYRTPIVLCDLEGQSRSCVARYLRVPEGTLSSRLARGRQLLKKRLERKGGVFTASALSGATLPSALSASVVEVCVLEAAANGVSGPTLFVSTLAREVLKSMVFDKVQRSLGMVLLFCTLLVGMGGVVRLLTDSRGKLPGPYFEHNPFPDREAVAFLAPVPPGLAEGENVTANLRHVIQLKETPHHIAFSPDGRFFHGVVGEQVFTWDVKTAQVQHTYPLPLSWIDNLVLSPDGKMAAGYYKKTAVVWNAMTGEKVHGIPHRDDLFSAIFSPDGQHLLTGTGTFTNVPDGAYINCRVMMWDVKTGRFVRQFEGLRRPPRALAFSREGHVLAFSTFVLTRWDDDSGKILAQHTFRGIGFEYPIFTPDARDCLVPTTRSFAVWSTQDGAKVREFPDHPVHVRWLDVSRHGRWVLSGCSSVDRTVRLWSLTSGNLLTTLTGHTNHLRGVALSPDSTLAITWSDDRTIRVHELTREPGKWRSPTRARPAE